MLAFVLIAAAGAKLLDLSGFVLVLRAYRIFPLVLLWPAAICVTAAELAVGGWLASGWRLLRGAQAALGLHAAYTGWALFILLRGVPILNCGCFGSSLVRPLSWTTVAENLVLVGLAALLVFLCRRRDRDAMLRLHSPPSA
jgi:hypothetical protein